MRIKSLLAPVLAVGVLTAGVVALVDGRADAGGDPKPDLRVSRKQAGPYVGDDEFPPTSQAITRRVKIGKRKNVYVEIENDGNGGNVVITGNPGHEDLKLKYFLGANNVSADVKGDGLQKFFSPGQTRTLRVRIRPLPGETDDKFFVNATDFDTEIQDDAVGVFVNVPPFSA